MFQQQELGAPTPWWPHGWASAPGPAAGGNVCQLNSWNLPRNIVIWQIYNVVLLRVNSWTFSYSYALESLFEIFLGVFRIFNPSPNWVTIMIPCQQAHGHCRFYSQSHQCIQLLQELEQEREQVFQREQQIHQRMEKCTEESPSQTTKTVFFTSIPVQVVHGISLQQKTLVRGAVDSEISLNGVWTRRFVVLEKQFPFKAISDFPRSAHSKLRIISLRSRPYSYGLCGGNAWKWIHNSQTYRCDVCVFCWKTDLKLEVSGLQRFGAVLPLTSTFRRPSSATSKLKDNWRFTRSTSKYFYIKPQCCLELFQDKSDDNLTIYICSQNWDMHATCCDMGGVIGKY